MAFTRWCVIAGPAIGFAAAMTAVPIASANPPGIVAPTPIDTIQELAGQGYDVQVTWVDGAPADVPLALCAVTGVNTSAHPIASVSIDCPPKAS